MILDAVTVFLHRVPNQKHAINKYAKIGSNGYLGVKERKTQLQMFLLFFPEEPV